MAKEIGATGFRVYLGVGNSLIPTEISNTLNINNNLIDSSDKGSGSWNENLDGRRDWSTDFELNYDPTDVVAMDLIDKILDPTTSTDTPVLVGKNTSTGDIGYTGTAKVGNISLSGGDQDLIKMSGSLTGNGALIKATVA